MRKRYVQEFIDNNQIQVLDVLIVERLGIGMTSQYVPFVGYGENSTPLFATLTSEGVFTLLDYEMDFFFRELRPTQIRRFQGTEDERDYIFNEINGNLNEETFQLILNWTDPRQQQKRTGNNAAAWAAGLGILGLGALLWGLLKDDD